MGAFNEAWSGIDKEVKCKKCNGPMTRYVNEKTGEVKHQCRSQCYGSWRESHNQRYKTRHDLPHGSKGGYH